MISRDGGRGQFGFRLAIVANEERRQQAGQPCERDRGFGLRDRGIAHREEWPLQRQIEVARRIGKRRRRIEIEPRHARDASWRLGGGRQLIGQM